MFKLFIAMLLAVLMVSCGAEPETVPEETQAAEETAAETEAPEPEYLFESFFDAKKALFEAEELAGQTDLYEEEGIQRFIAIKQEMNSILGTDAFDQAMAEKYYVRLTEAKKHLKYKQGDIPRVYIKTSGGQGWVDWDYRDCDIVIVSAEDEKYKVTEGSAEISLRGNSTAGAPKQPFNIRFEDKVSVLGMDKGRRWAFLANLYDKSLMRNYNGISAVATDLGAISKCYGQAKRIIQSLYMSENENIVQCYAPADSLQENPITLELMTHLYTTLICGRYPEAEKELNSIEEFYKRMPYLYETCREQIFYSLKNLFHTVVMYLNCENFQQQIPIYSESLRCGQIISAYKAYAAWICDYIAQNKKSHNEGLKEKILSIIHERYGDCELSAYGISQEVGITENYLGKFVKEQTGESFSAYLLRIRIEKAREYLERTDYSNKEIAALTGFASVNTFYRNFQKLTGVSPKFYKEKGARPERENQ